MRSCKDRRAWLYCAAERVKGGKKTLFFSHYFPPTPGELARAPVIVRPFVRTQRRCIFSAGESHGTIIKCADGNESRDFSFSKPAAATTACSPEQISRKFRSGSLFSMTYLTASRSTLCFHTMHRVGSFMGLFSRPYPLHTFAGEQSTEYYHNTP